MTDFVSHLLQQAVWIQVWVAWMGLVNMASMAFLREREAKVVLAVFAGNFVFMTLLFELNGFNRLLGLSHVILWTPLMIYLLRRLQAVNAVGWYGAWLRVLLLTNGASLIFDYADVIRYLLGERT